MSSHPSTWQEAAAKFFSERGGRVSRHVSFEELCYVSGRDPRLWCQPGMYDDLITSVLVQAEIGSGESVLEVGCAAGFLAHGLSPSVSQYLGVDVAKGAIQAARRLRLPNAEFRRADGTSLPFADDTFHHALCYDVITNFPSFPNVVPIITDMLRVVRPRGTVLVGSIPDAEREATYLQRVLDVGRDLDTREGPTCEPEAHQTPGVWGKLWHSFLGRREEVLPAITCYYFRREDFQALGESLGVDVRIFDIHPANPYRGCRFNAVFKKPGA